MDRALVAIQSRREFQPAGGKLGVYFGGVVQGVEGQLEFGTYDPAIQAHITLGTNIDIEWDEAPGKCYEFQQDRTNRKPSWREQARSFG